MRSSILLVLGLAMASLAPAVAQEARQVRAIALGPRMDVRIAASEESFRSEIERLMARAHREFASDRPNLVVLGGSWDLVTAYLGPEHEAARKAASVKEAHEALQAAHFFERLWPRTVRWGVSAERELLLGATDRLYRPFVRAFSQAARRHGAYVLAATAVADVDGMKPFQSLRTFKDRPVAPSGSDVFRKAFLFDPDGRLVGEAKQVFMRADEDLAGGELERVHPFDLPFGKVGVALGEEARHPDYLARLDEAGCQILLQPGLDPGSWAQDAGSGGWKPDEWLDVTLGPLQASRSAHLQYTVSAMPSGLYYDTCFDGQSAIMGRSDRVPWRLYVGVDPEDPRRPYRGDVLALTPWVVEDPRFVHGSAGPATSLSDRREYLRKVARSLMKGGKRENQFVESCATADLVVR